MNRKTTKRPVKKMSPNRRCAKPLRPRATRSKGAKAALKVRIRAAVRAVMNRADSPNEKALRALILRAARSQAHQQALALKNPLLLRQAASSRVPRPVSNPRRPPSSRARS